MTRLAGCAVVLWLLVPVSAGAHRLDEYLQATLISVESGRVRGEIRLAPGAFVWEDVLAAIDTDRDGAVSFTEQRAYGERVLSDLLLTVDGQRLSLQLTSAQSASIDFLTEGMGDIRIDFEAAVPAGSRHRRLIFENYHQRWMSAYLVNSLVPNDPDIRLGMQTRNHDQTSYRLDYEQAGVASFSTLRAWWSYAWAPLAVTVGIMMAGAAVLRRSRCRSASAGS